MKSKECSHKSKAVERPPRRSARQKPVPTRRETVPPIMVTQGRHKIREIQWSVRNLSEKKSIMGPHATETRNKIHREARPRGDSSSQKLSPHRRKGNLGKERKYQSRSRSPRSELHRAKDKAILTKTQLHFLLGPTNRQN